MISEQTKGIAAASLQTAISIATFFFAKAALVSLPAGPMVLVRSVGAALVLLVVAMVVREPAAPARGDYAKLVLLGLFGVPLNQGFFLWGLEQTTPAHAALVYALTPAVVLLVGIALGTEALVRGRALGIGLAIAGVAIVLAPKADGGAGSVRGDLLVVAAMLCWALYTALARGVVARVGAVRATACALGFGALEYLPFGLWVSRDFDWSTVTPSAWIGVAWLVVMASTIAYLCWYYAIRRLAPSRVAVFNNLQPVGTTAIAWLAGTDRASLAFAVGGALVVAGVLLAQRPTGLPPAARA